MKHRVIILLLFILTMSFLDAKSPDPKAVVGKIDNITYTYAEYDKILSNYYAYYQKRLCLQKWCKIGKAEGEKG